MSHSKMKFLPFTTDTMSMEALEKFSNLKTQEELYGLQHVTRVFTDTGMSDKWMRKKKYSPKKK